MNDLSHIFLELMQMLCILILFYVVYHQNNAINRLLIKDLQRCKDLINDLEKRTEE